MQLQNNSVYLKSFFASGWIFAYYVITSTLNSKLRLFYRPLSLRVVLYSIAGIFCYGNYAFFNDYTQVNFYNFPSFQVYIQLSFQVNYDNSTDEKLAALGKGFVEAGIRFYDKLLKKNIACRQLTGDNSQYTSFGNEEFLIRTKRAPLTSRKVFFEQKLKELIEQEKKTGEGEKSNV